MTYEKWKQLSDEGYSSDAISLLSFINEGVILDENHPKSMALWSFLVRKDLVNGADITSFGKSMLESVGLVGVIPEKPKKMDKFEEWWKVYPSTDSFTIDGQTFPGVQSKKLKKDKSKEEFNKAIKEGISADSIIEATRYHINSAKKLSIKKRDNQVSYIANSERYLRERMYLPYIELLNNKVEESTFKSNIL